MITCDKNQDELHRNRIMEHKRMLSSKTVSEYFRKVFRMLPERFQNTSADIFEYLRRGFQVLPERFSNISGEVSEYFRKGFRIPTKRFPNTFEIHRDLFSHLSSKEPGKILWTLVEV